MKLSKETMIKIASGAVIALTVFSVTVISVHNNKQPEAVAKTESETGVLAGVSNVFNSGDVVIPSFTSGVSSVLNDFPAPSISKTDVAVVALGADEGEEAAE